MPFIIRILIFMNGLAVLSSCRKKGKRNYLKKKGNLAPLVVARSSKKGGSIFPPEEEGDFSLIANLG